jgi:hypothetical protein
MSRPLKHGPVSQGSFYDNLKSAVLERQGNVIRFHPTLFEFAGRYRFDPRLDVSPGV